MRKKYIEDALALCESHLEYVLRDNTITSPKCDLIYGVKEIIGLLIVTINRNNIRN